MAHKPLFQIDTLLAVPDVILHPTTNEVVKFVLQCIRESVEGYDQLFYTSMSYRSRFLATARYRLS